MQDLPNALCHLLYDPRRRPAGLSIVSLVDARCRARFRWLPAGEPIRVLPEDSRAWRVLGVRLIGPWSGTVGYIRIQARRQ